MSGPGNTSHGTPGPGGKGGKGGSGTEPGHPLIEAFLDGDLAPAQGQELTAWLTADPANLQRFVRETHTHHALHDIFAARAAARSAADEVIVVNEEESSRRARVVELRQARRAPHSKTAFRRYGAAIAAVAAIAILGLTVWLWQTRYPAPAAQGVYHIDGGGGLARGATVVAERDDAQLTLGNYCNITMASGSALRIDGADRQEAVFLTKGRVDCAVDRNVGSFHVRTDVGSVSVTGTRFTVELVPQQGVQGMNRKAMAFAMLVAVTTGSVKVDFGGQETVLRVGESHLFGADNQLPPPPPGGQPGMNNQGNGVNPPPRPNRPPPPPPPGMNNNGAPNLPPPLPGGANPGQGANVPPPPPQGQNADPAGTNMPPPPNGGPNSGPNQGPNGQNMPPKPPPPPPFMVALDTDKDGELSAEEIANAAEALKTLDHNGDGKLDHHELFPVPPPPPPGQGQPGQSQGEGQNGPPGPAGNPNMQGGPGAGQGKNMPKPPMQGGANVRPKGPPPGAGNGNGNGMILPPPPPAGDEQ